MKKTLIYLLILVGTIIGTSAAQASTINFSGYTWQVKNGLGGPGPNNWGNASDQVFVDSLGRLHLTVSKQNNQWYSSEVYLKNSLGYGQYIFDVDTTVDKLDPSLVAAPFLYQDDTHEIDIEFSYWKNPTGPNLYYTVQPFDAVGNQSKTPFILSSGTSRHIINWKPTDITFSSSQNNTNLANWQYFGKGNFVPGNEKVHINFWQYQGTAPTNNANSEFIIKNFQFVPYSQIVPVAPVVVVPVSTLTNPPAVAVLPTISTVVAPKPKVVFPTVTVPIQNRTFATIKTTVISVPKVVAPVKVISNKHMLKPVIIKFKKNFKTQKISEKKCQKVRLTVF